MRSKKIIIIVLLISCLMGCSSESSQVQEDTKLIETSLADQKLNLEETEEVNAKMRAEETKTNVVDEEDSQEAEKDLENSREDTDGDTQEVKVHNKEEKSVDLSLQEQVTSSATIVHQVENQVESKVAVQETPQPLKVELEDEKVEQTVKLSISCSTILNNKDQFNSEKLELLPVDGVILTQEEMPYEEGETVFDVLVRATKDKKIHMEYTGSSTYNTNYIEGIHNIYEFDCGPLSGWMYKVNGIFPNYGCSNYTLKDGDVIEWVYTCDLGKDVGGSEMFREGEE